MRPCERAPDGALVGLASGLAAEAVEDSLALAEIEACVPSGEVDDVEQAPTSTIAPRIANTRFDVEGTGGTWD